MTAPPLRTPLCSGRRPTPARPESDSRGNECAPDRLLADPEPQPHLQERQAAGVQLNSFRAVVLIKPRRRIGTERRIRCAAEVRR